MTKTKDKNSISIALEELETIVNWFQEQQDVDVEEGLRKVKDGATLIKDLKSRLKKVENEFQEVKKELEKEV